MIKTYAEWDDQELILLSIPHVNTDWKPYLDDILRSYEELVSQICKYQKVLLIAPQINDFVRFSKFK
ncbi:MAG: agmatine deiminase family protein, partial [Campylobacter hyointestinalis]